MYVSSRMPNVIAYYKIDCVLPFFILSHLASDQRVEVTGIAFHQELILRAPIVVAIVTTASPLAADHVASSQWDVSPRMPPSMF